MSFTSFLPFATDSGILRIRHPVWQFACKGTIFPCITQRRMGIFPVAKLRTTLPPCCGIASPCPVRDRQVPAFAALFHWDSNRNPQRYGSELTEIRIGTLRDVGWNSRKYVLQLTGMLVLVFPFPCRIPHAFGRQVKGERAAVGWHACGLRLFFPGGV